ncbi:MAG TPA: tRNA-specific adenosine deaminase [Rhodospirillaceae bacterium]|nr:MAG: tRNA-specific adenosine deaminase [Alphaproteobacteria bacterium GWF2_58_20]HAU28523.1 tRNA-specific adenosine deaminase [Rhodospirillaceae bacterium]
MTLSVPTSPLQQAFIEAEKAAERGEIPVGAVIYDPAGKTIVAAAGNRVIETSDPTAHAEILAIRAACMVMGAPRIPDLEIFVTLEPCAMCAAAIAQARLKKLTFAAYDPKGGGVEHGPRFFTQPTCHHHPEIIGGIEERRAAELLRAFFMDKRE